MNIYGSKILLRGIEESDLELLWTLMNDPDIEHTTGGWHFPISFADQKRWFQNYRSDEHNQRWIIEVQETHEAIGLLILPEIDWKNREAEYGIKLKAGTFRGRGYATDAILTMMQYAFEELGMHRLFCTVVDYNIPSLAMNERCGAKREGLKREAVYKKGAWHDVVCFGALYEDYLSARQRFDARNLKDSPT